MISFDTVKTVERVSLIDLLELLATLCRSEVYQNTNLHFINSEIQLSPCSRANFWKVSPQCIIFEGCTPLQSIEDFMKGMPVKRSKPDANSVTFTRDKESNLELPIVPSAQTNIYILSDFQYQ